MRLTVKTKIWMTVITIVLMFAFFVLLYLPAVQERYILNSFNKEVQNYANTVALGVKIAMTEQNFEGVQTAMDFVKKDPQLEYVSLLNIDTVWNDNHSTFKLKKTVFKTYPETGEVNVNANSTEYSIVKRAGFTTPMMSGEILLSTTTSEIIKSRKQIRLTSLFFSLVVFAIGIIIGFSLSRNISIPVLALRDAANKVGEGDLTQRVISTSKDEIGELSIAFNKMVNDLAIARHDVEVRSNELMIEKKKTDDLLIELQTTLSDLNETHEQLIRHEKLASIGQLTKGLVDRILNPLNYINNFSAISNELVNEIKESLSGKRYEDDFSIQEDVLPLLELTKSNGVRINEHGTNLSKIVRSMEKLLRVKSDNFILSDINSLINHHFAIALDEAKREYKDITVDIVKEFDSRCSPINVLPAELGSVIGHLVNNAVFSIHEKSKIVEGFKSRISIKTTFLTNNIDIRIEDNGKGIPEKEVELLFSPFSTTKPTAKGSGLGLFISQDIIKMHRGFLWVDTKEGEYAAFTIRLPVPV